MDEPVRDVEIEVGGVRLPGLMGEPGGATGLVIFAHGSGSSRLSARNGHVASILREGGLATVLCDLLTEAEATDRRRVFDIDLLARRLEGAAAWARGRSALRIGHFGASTGAAAALVAASRDESIGAVVSRGGRPDLAGEALALVKAPTLLIVGGRDEAVLEMNRGALERMTCERRLEIVPGATHLFEEPGTLDRAGALARDWLTRWL